MLAQDASFCNSLGTLRTWEDVGKKKLLAVGIETIILLETKEFCGAAWPSMSLKGKQGHP